MNLPSRVRANRQGTGSFFHALLCGLYQHVLPGVKLGLASHNLVRKKPLEMAGVLVDSRYSQIDNQV